jgi:hypothetical protein
LPLDGSHFTCVDSGDLYKDLNAIQPPVATVLLDRDVDLSKDASEDATNSVLAVIRAEAGAEFTPALSASFETAFKTELSKQLSQSSGTAVKISFYKVTLDGAFDLVVDIPYVTKYPPLQKCKGLPVIVGVYGFVVTSLTASSGGNSEDSTRRAVDAALQVSANILPSVLYTKIKASVSETATKVASARYRVVQNLGDSQFTTVWYLRKQVPDPAPAPPPPKR